MNKGKKKDICLFCKKCIGNGERNKSNVRVKSLILPLENDMVLHTKCWNSLKINTYDKG